METIVNIPRHNYLGHIMPYARKGIIKILTGQRRVGKSFVLKSIGHLLRETDPEGNFIHIDLEDFAFSHIDSAQGLHQEITSRLSERSANYIFIDEIQEIEGFEKVIRSLNLDPRNDIYITGSNSAMLSSEIATRLAGRSMETKIHPLSYKEFLTFHSLEDSQEAVEQYLRFGGMPYLRNLPVQSTWNEYLTSLTDAVVYRDIVSRHSLRNTDFLERMLLFLGDNIGQIFTAKRIADYLKSQRIGGTVVSVQNYVDYICQAFVANKVKRWDMEGRRYFEIGEKYYFEDLGIRNAIVGYRPQDIGGLLENAVYNGLSIGGYSVKVGVLEKQREIDFVAERGGETLYVQVAVNIDSPATAERELGNLQGIDDDYPKLLVTLRDSAPNTFKGIRMMSLREFLLSL